MFTQRFEFTNSIGRGWNDPTATGANIVVVTNTATKLVFDAYLSGDASNTVSFYVTAKSLPLSPLMFSRSGGGINKYKINIINPAVNPTVTYHINNVSTLLPDGTLVSGGMKNIDTAIAGAVVRNIKYTYTLSAEGYDTYAGSYTVTIPIGTNSDIHIDPYVV